LDSQVFYPTEQQQQEQQQTPLILSPSTGRFFRRGCPYCRSYLLSTREEMDKHIDDCRTIFLQQDQKPVVKKEEHKDNLDIAQNDLEEKPSVDSLFDEAESYFLQPPPCDFCKFIANTYDEYHTHLTTSHPEIWMSESSDTDILQIPIITLTDDSDDSDDSDEKSMPSTSWRQHNSFDIQFPPPPPPSSAPPPPPRPSSANYKENHCRRSSNNNTTTTTTTTTTNTTENKSSTSRNSTSTNTSSTSRNSTSTNTNSTRSSSSTSSKSFKNKLSSNSQHFDMLVNRWKKNPFFVNVESDAEQLIPVADSADSKSKSANSESTNVNMQQQEKHVKEKKKTGNLKRRRQKQQQQSQSSFKRQKK
jgi:glutaredoxin